MRQAIANWAASHAVRPWRVETLVEPQRYPGQAAAQTMGSIYALLPVVSAISFIIGVLAL